MFTLALASVLAISLAANALGAVQADVQKLFEAGQYEQLIQLVRDRESPAPEDLYLAGYAASKLDPPDLDAAREFFARFEGEESDPWTFIARSAAATLDHNGGAAAEVANQAATRAPQSLYAQYQLGLALAEKKDMGGAAQAFDRAIAVDPNFAYAHYYGGMAYYQIKRVDRMANAFERFLKLAPEAPERPAIESLMRSIRR